MLNGTLYSHTTLPTKCAPSRSILCTLHKHNSYGIGNFVVDGFGESIADYKKDILTDAKPHQMYRMKNVFLIFSCACI